MSKQPMRILFLHAAMNGLTAEYKVHTTLAMNVDRGKLDPYFIWQSPVEVVDKIRVTAHDFGRDMSIQPKPNRYQRAGMMLSLLPKTFAFLSSSIKQIKPDLIYTSQQNFDVRLATLLSRYFRIPHVIHIHYSVGPWLGKYTLNVIQKSSRLIAVSEYVRQTALLQGVPSSSIHTIVNPAPFSFHPCNQKPETIRAEFHLSDQTPLVIAVGRLDPGKGHPELINAFARVIQQMPDARLLICGSSTTRDNYEASLRQRVAELGLSEFIVFTGQRNDIPSIMRSANAFCLPAELEPFGLVFLEAMIVGLPVVACYSGGVPEIVVHNETGLLSYPGDISALATNLLRILSDPTYARCLGDVGKLRASTEFAPSRIADRWLNVIHEMVEDHQI
jgi:glycosyltransferase involved in cell wall biosynthesis